jgi:Helix-turn-helix domain/Protein of unknown function (DUF2690)
MPRPERPLDPTDGPIADFAAMLRQQRERAGRPTYRAMARKAHRSQTTLSEAAGGRTLPTWETTVAFLDACGVTDTAPWRQRWEQCRNTIRTDGESAGDRLEPPLKRPSRRQIWITVVAGSVILVAAAVVSTSLIMKSGDGAASDRGPTNSPQVSISNGADPEDTGCANDAAGDTVDAREVALDQIPIGMIELRYSPRCGASWPRFTPADPRYATINKPGPIDIDLAVVVDDPQRTTISFSTRYIGLPVFGNMANSTNHCVIAQASLYGPGWRSSLGSTRCFQGAVAVE